MDADPPYLLLRRLLQVVGEVLRGCRGRRADTADDADLLAGWRADAELLRALVARGDDGADDVDAVVVLQLHPAAKSPNLGLSKSPRTLGPCPRD